MITSGRRFLCRGTIPKRRATGARELYIRSCAQPEQVLAVRPMEPDRGAGVSGPRSQSEEFRHVAALRHIAVLRRRVRLLPVQR